MNGLKDAILPIRRITPADGYHYFYGYYDTQAFDQNNRYHLCSRVSFWDRLPIKEDVNQLGMINLTTREFIPLAETTAWNFQQNAMLQWNPANPVEEIVYNIRCGEEYRGVIHNINTGKKRELSRAIANISPNGRWGLSINFNRVYDFRPGYGYAGIKDQFYDTPQPENDGIYLINMESGESKLVVSYAQMGKWFAGDVPEIDNCKLVINPITFNTDSSRFLFLVRNFPPIGDLWYTGMGTVNYDGTDFFKMKKYSYASHYNWRDKDHILIYASSELGTGLHLFTDKSTEVRRIAPEQFTMDFHCSYSPDRKYIVGDGYPDSDLSRPVFLFNAKTEKGIQLFRVKSHPVAEGDIRCDLHTRWSRDGRIISFDSTHEGFRGVYTADIFSVLNRI